MSRSRILSSIAAAAFGIGLLGACSTDALTERAVGFGLEQAIDGDQDIDLDFGSDGSGGFSISTEEGDFAINFDEENGSIIFDTEDGAGVINIDEDAGAITFETDEGDGVINFDEEGSITFDTDEGAGSINIDEDAGIFSFETEEGTAVFGGTEVPDAWPAAIGVPATANPEATFFSELNLGADTVLSGIFEHSPDEPFAAKAEAALKAAGWTVVTESEDGAGGRYVQFSNGAHTASLAGDGDGFTAITINISNE